MKKLGLIVLSAVAILSLAGCNTSKKAGEDSEGSKVEKKTTSKSKLASITIDDGEYILPQEEETSENEGFLALKLTFKNESGKNLDISGDSIMLYDKEDSKIEPVNIYSDDNSKVNYFSYEKLSGKKSKTGYIVFPVEKDAKYKLYFEPMIFDAEKEVEPIILDVDASEYKDRTKEALKAAEAFVDEVFLAKENKSYEKLVLNNKQEAIQNNDASFAKALKDKFYSYKPTEEEASKIAKTLRETNGTAGKVEYELYSFSPDTAVVLANVDAVTFKEMSAAIRDAQDQYLEQDSDLSFEEDMKLSDKAAIDKMPEIIKTTTPVEIDSYGDGFRVLLKKNDKDKWEIQTKGTNARFDNFERAFIGDY